jgi:hypothetical protein
VAVSATDTHCKAPGHAGDRLRHVRTDVIDANPDDFAKSEFPSAAIDPLLEIEAA